MDRDARPSRRYDDGEVTRYGAGESYRPFNDRSPRRPRSPERDRARSPANRDRPRSPAPLDSDRYIPDRAPRRRSRTPERYRRDRSRGRIREDDRAIGGDTWRRRDRTRSPRRSPRRRSSPHRRPSPRRNSPPPRRYSPLRRDTRDERDRVQQRSPRRGFEPRDERSFPPPPQFGYSHAGRSEVSDNPNSVPVSSKRRLNVPSCHAQPSSDRTVPHGFVPARYLGFSAAQYSPGKRQNRFVNLPNQPDDPQDYHSPPYFFIDSSRRPRSRSPLDRDRRDTQDRDRDRRSPRQASPLGARGDTFKRRSPSRDRRDDRYGSSYRRPSPLREPTVTSLGPSRDNSRRSSPHPTSSRRDDRSVPQSPLASRPPSRSSQRIHGRERSPVRASIDTTPPIRSPPRGPAALRPPPTGPRGDTRDPRDMRHFPGQSSTAIGPPAKPAPVPATTVPNRQETVVPSNPPSGPRGYAGPRGGYGRGGRGNTWVNTNQVRNIPPSNGPASANTGTNIPAGPRAASTSNSVPSTPIPQSRPFNPPKGPAAEKRPSVAEQQLASLPPIIPGGRIDAMQEAITEGILPELMSHYRQLKIEEEKIRQEIDTKNDKLRANLAQWEKGQREAELLQLKSTLAEQALAKSSGDGIIGAAF